MTHLPVPTVIVLWSDAVYAPLPTASAQCEHTDKRQTCTSILPDGTTVRTCGGCDFALNIEQAAIRLADGSRVSLSW